MAQRTGGLDYPRAADRLDYERYEKIRKLYLEAQLAYSITISPQLKDYEGCELAHNKLMIHLISRHYLQDFYLVPEFAEGRMHYHGMIKIKRTCKKDTLKHLKQLKREIEHQDIGFVDIPKRAVGVQWFNYIHKDQFWHVFYDKKNPDIQLSKDYAVFN